MSYFGKVKFGKDSNFDDASDLAQALRNAGYKVKERPENGQLYFDEEGSDE